MDTTAPCARCSKKSTCTYYLSPGRGIRVCGLCARLGEVVGDGEGYRVRVGQRLSKKIASLSDANGLLGRIRVGLATI